MSMCLIDSLDDPRLAPFGSLKATNDTRWSGQFVAEGDKLVRRLLASKFRVHSLLVGRAHADEMLGLAPAETEVLVVDDRQIDQIVGFNFHRGLLACAERGPQLDLATICDANADALSIVVCPDVQDPENLGSILRSSAALGVDAVVLGRDCCDPYSRRVLRVSMGAALQIPIVESRDLTADLHRARQAGGLELWAAVTNRDAAPLDRLARPPRLGLLLGSEGHGLLPEWVELCDRRVTIPMRPGTDSLNVAVAAGIALYQLMGLRQADSERPEP